MMWWLENPARARAERQSVAELAERVNWLVAVRWHLTHEAALAVDFEVEHDGQSFPLTMTYASFHPNAPPIVVPRDGSRLSDHQYGDGGNLCLEFRADNWSTSINGAMMMESAHKLIAGERDGGGRELPSAHHVSIGQSARGAFIRFLVTPACEQCLRSIDPGRSVQICLAEKYHTEALTITITDIDGVPDLGAWPSGIRSTAKQGNAVRLPSGMSLPSSTQDSLVELLDGLGLLEIREQALTHGEDLDLVLVTEQKLTHFYAFDSGGERHFGRSRTLMVGAIESRVAVDYSGLADKSVGIVGCGSLGSKIAAMLVRSGVRCITLVDDDILFSANLTRNELSALAVGVHKVDALRTRLIEIAGTIDITVRRVALGGQESSNSTDSVMSALSKCDVIIDVTADPHCFNFCAAVAKSSLKPFIWGEVFAGGIGGLVARVRSGHEPEPQAARNQINAWCDAHAIPAPLSSFATPYSASSGNEPPLVADDAEVAIIAGHLARFATDVLLHPQTTEFPVPAYVIGLRKAWIFEEPFDTRPIELVGSGPWATERDSASMTDAFELLREFLPSAFDGDDQSPK